LENFYFLEIKLELAFYINKYSYIILQDNLNEHDMVLEMGNAA
jgi:hypothetical protein